MKYQSVRRLLGAVTLLVTGIGVAPGVLADGAAIISHPPATTPGLLTVTDGSTASLNEARAPVTSDVGYTAVTSAEADTTSGVLGGYAGFELEADATTVQTVIGTPEDPAVSEPKIGDTLAVSHATSVLSLQATVGGDRVPADWSPCCCRCTAAFSPPRVCRRWNCSARWARAA
ncbi:MAG: hypothetical protein IPM80_16460 [Proteobacteria bacterium]|nr:hypothetical protein [Pseudomonadota bacterium]